MFVQFAGDELLRLLQHCVEHHVGGIHLNPEAIQGFHHDTEHLLEGMICVRPLPTQEIEHQILPVLIVQVRWILTVHHTQQHVANVDASNTEWIVTTGGQYVTTLGTMVLEQVNE